MTNVTSLLDRLPAVRGRLTEGASLAKVTWFRVGGPAEVLFKPADVADLQSFLAGCPADVPVTVLGVGSNLLVRDGGIPGVVIRLGRAFAEIRTEGMHIFAGAAALDLNVALSARAAGIGLPRPRAGTGHGRAELLERAGQRAVRGEPAADGQADAQQAQCERFANGRAILTDSDSGHGGGPRERQAGVETAGAP